VNRGKAGALIRDPAVHEPIQLPKSLIEIELVGMKPVYQYIEFCRSTKTLWRKIASGTWDWLGVHRNGQFVLGRPKQSTGSGYRGSLTVGDAEAGHGVRVHVPLGPGPSATWFRTEQEAEEEFTRVVDRLSREEEGPALYKVDRVAGGEVVEAKYVVSRPSTYL
jgi:hypothetical protein